MFTKPAISSQAMELLQQPNVAGQQEYYKQVHSSMYAGKVEQYNETPCIAGEALMTVSAPVAQLTAGRGLEVKDAGEYRGKGVFALQVSWPCQPPPTGHQLPASPPPRELATLLSQPGAISSVQHFGEGDVLFTEPPLCAIQHSTNRQEAWVCSHCFRFIGSVEAQLARLLLALQGVGGSDGASSDGSEGSEGPGVDDEVVEALVSRQVRLPHTSAFPLPVAVRCRGGCSEEWYCSTGCEQAEWEQCHQLLCTGAAESGDSSGGGSSEPAASAGMGKQAAAEAVHDRETADRETERQQLAAAVMEFNDLADATNDVFRLAAKVVVMTILRAERLVDERAAVGSNGAGAGVSSRGGTSATPEQCWQALQQAWLPWAVGHKGLWWECVAAPEEAKADMRQLATDSLELMTSALPPQLAARYCPLLSLEVWASIIGMFEMNNLSIYVASPLQRWLELLEGLPELQHQAALEEAGEGCGMVAWEGGERLTGCQPVHVRPPSCP